MITPLSKWLAEVDLKAKSKAVYATINSCKIGFGLYRFFVFLFSLLYPHFSQAIEASRVTLAFCTSMFEPTRLSWVSSGAACYP